jgi:O-antigen/teichoic acid export membrane protein
MLERTLALIFLVSIPLSLGGAILGTQIMRLVFGVGYIAGGLALSVLMLNLSFDYAGSVVATGIFAYDHQKILIISSAIAGVSNVLFDLHPHSPLGHHRIGVRHAHRAGTGQFLSVVCHEES